MKKEIHDNLKQIGFNPFTAVTIEFPSKIFIETLPPGNNESTNIYVYFKNTKDFVVVFPNMYQDSFRADYYGSVDAIQKKINNLKDKIEKGEI